MPLPPPVGRLDAAASSDFPFVLALLRREWTSVWHLPAAAIVAAGSLLFGRRLAETAALAPATSTLAVTGGTVLATFGRICGVVVAIAGVLLVVERLASDADSRWTALPFAAGASRAAYLLTVTLAAAAVVMLGAPLALLAFAAGAAPGNATLMRAMIASMPGVVAVAASCTFYGALCATITRGRGAALALAASGLALPGVLLAAYRTLAGQPPPGTLMRLATLHLPPLTISSTPRALAWHLGWCVIAGVVLAALARSVTGRER